MDLFALVHCVIIATEATRSGLVAAPRPLAALPSTRGYAPVTAANPTKLPPGPADPKGGRQVYFRKGLLVELLRVKLPNWVVNVVCKIYVKASKVGLSLSESQLPRVKAIQYLATFFRKCIRQVKPWRNHLAYWA